MEKARLNLLSSEIEAQLSEIDKIYQKIEDRKSRLGSQEAYESIAYQLHNLYCAFEDLFKIVAEYFENSIKDSTRYHSELLRRMHMSIEGIRPALINEEGYLLLNNIRAFRHFFRHAYTYNIDPRKLGLVLDDAEKLRSSYREMVAHFLKSLA